MSGIYDRDEYRPLLSQLRPYYDGSLQHETDLGDEADNDGYRITWGPSLHSILGGLHFPPPVKKTHLIGDNASSSSAVGGLGKVKRSSVHAGLQSPTRLSANGGVAISCASSGTNTVTESATTATGLRSTTATRSTSDGAAAASASRASASRFSKRRKRYGTSAPCLTGMLNDGSSAGSNATHLVVDNEEASRMLDALTARLEAKALQHQQQREVALARESEKENMYKSTRCVPDLLIKEAEAHGDGDVATGKGKERMKDDCDMSQEMAAMYLDMVNEDALKENSGSRVNVMGLKDCNAKGNTRIATVYPSSRILDQPLSMRPINQRSISSPQSTSQYNTGGPSTARLPTPAIAARPLPLVYDMSLENGDSFDVDDSMAFDGVSAKALPTKGLFEDLSRQQRNGSRSKSSDQAIAVKSTNVVKDSQGEGSDPFATRMQASQNELQEQEDESYWNDDSADMILVMSQMPIPPPPSSAEAVKSRQAVPIPAIQERKILNKSTSVAAPAWKGFERRDLRRNYTSSSSSGCESDVVAATIKHQKKEERKLMISPHKKKRLSIAKDGSIAVPPSPGRTAVPRNSNSNSNTTNSQPLQLKNVPLPVVGNKRTSNASPSTVLVRSSGGTVGQNSCGRSKSASSLEKGPGRKNLKAAFKPPTIIRPEIAARAKEKVQLAKAERRAASAGGMGLSQCKPAPVLELDFELDWPSDGELSF